MARKNKTWTKQNMESAVKAVRKGEMGYLKASKLFHVPSTTLERYCKNVSNTVDDIKVGRKPVFTPQMENTLVDYCLQMERKYFGLSRPDIRRLAFRLAELNNLKHPFSEKNGKAGKKWLMKFLLRHKNKISVRTPENLSYARAKGFRRENVNQFFDIYEPEFQKIGQNPLRLFNVDETGITIVQHKTVKIIGMKGKRQVAALSSAERGGLITVVTCMSAGGQHLPPKLIWPRKNMKLELMDGTPPGSTWACHPSGWIQSEIFTDWLREFINITKPTADDPVLLVLDGHYSHTRNLDFVNLVRENHVSIVCLPPHSTHKMQPLDVSFMSPFKTYYAAAITDWIKTNHRPITPYQLGKVFGEAFAKTATYNVAANGFRRTGLYPCNRNIFEDHEFVVEENIENEIENIAPVPNSSNNVVVEGNIENTAPVNNIIVEENIENIVQVPHSSNNDAGNSLTENYITPESNRSSAPEMPSTSGTVRKQLFKTPSSSNSSRSSDGSFTVSPFQICPVPKLKTSNSQKGRKPGSALLVTSSPHKKLLSASKNNQNKKEVAKRMNPTSKKKLKRATTASKKKATKVDSNDTTACIYCCTLYARDTSNEDWLQCSLCKDWAHEGCAGELNNGAFICDLCVEEN